MLLSIDNKWTRDYSVRECLSVPNCSGPTGPIPLISKFVTVITRAVITAVRVTVCRAVHCGGRFLGLYRTARSRNFF